LSASISGDLDDAAHVQHTYMRTAVIPPRRTISPGCSTTPGLPTWSISTRRFLRREAELAAQLGAEVFVIDAGWWAPSRRTSDNFTTGLGRVAAERREVSQRHPGLWRLRALSWACALASGSSRNGWICASRPPGGLDWLVRHHDAIVSPPWPPDTVSGWLCFGHPDVQAWAIDWISRLVEAVNADWLKWDSNWWGVCTCTNHGHSATDGEFHQVQGVHAVLAELRRRFPNLIIENCAGGGTRTDFAMLANTHITWLHDASTPSRRVRFHLAGANYLFPPELCNTWVVDADDESLTDPATPRPTSTPSRAAACYGAFGVSARLRSGLRRGLCRGAGGHRPVQGAAPAAQARPLLPPAAAG
jgi:alpha-galactosidase